MATLGTIFAGSWLAMAGGEKPKTAQGPPISASSKDEENFIQYVHPFDLTCAGGEDTRKITD